jgi:transcriptional regulator with XRE-family HTH domain
MSRNSPAKLTAEIRATLARRVKSLRLEQGMKQEELAENANVSRQTLSDIENGNTTPQAKVLQRIYQVLGIDIEPVSFDEQTDIWLGILGTLIEAVPADRRPRAVDGAMRAITHELNAPDNVIRGRFGADVGAPTEDDLDAVARPADPEPTDEQ